MGIHTHFQARHLEKRVKRKFPINNEDIIYPDYYKKPFHAYERGNLCWDAAFELESTTEIIARTVCLDQVTMRKEFADCIRLYSCIDTPPNVASMDNNRIYLDIGCSIGLSTEYIHNEFNFGKSIGLDLSPYYLAVAYERRNKNIEYMHSNAECIKQISSDKLNLITIQYVLHELPTQNTINILRECMRILKPNGILAIVDINPIDLVAANPIILKMFKASEPWIEEYSMQDLELTLKSLGFNNVKKNKIANRHIAYICCKTCV